MNRNLPHLWKVLLCFFYLVSVGITTVELTANHLNLEDDYKSAIATTEKENESGSFFPDFETATLSTSLVTCKTGFECKDGKLLTERKIGYGCITVIVTPTCHLGEKYDPHSCSCQPITTTPISTHINSHYSTCDKICDKVWCEKDGTKYKLQLDRSICDCVPVLVAKVNCNYGQVYDVNQCKCVKGHSTGSLCNKTCNTNTLCDGHGSFYKEKLDPTTCNCIKVPVQNHIPKCDDKVWCDGTGKFFKDVYDQASCGCKKVLVQNYTTTCNDKVWCDGKGSYFKEVYDAKSCGCVKVAAPNHKPKCNNQVWCDGKGKFFKEVYDSKSCGCVKVAASNQKPTCNTQPWCDGQGKFFKEVYDSKSCGCVKVAIENHRPTCPPGKHYDKSSCSCVKANCYTSCSKKVRCDGYGKLTKQVLDPTTCTCETVPVAGLEYCPHGTVFDAPTCSCAPHHPSPSQCHKQCDTKTYCDGHGNLTTQKLNKAHCKCETVSVAKPTCPSGKVFDPKSCGCKPSNQPPAISCKDIKITSGKGKLVISNLNAPSSVVKIFDQHWQLVYSCSGNCGKEVTLTDIKGKYHVNVAFYDASWRYVCGIKEWITVSTHLQDNAATGRSATPTNLVTDNTAFQTPHAVYPNPANELINVQLSGYVGQAGVIRLVDQFGKVVRQLQIDTIKVDAIQLPIQELEDGLYFLNIVLDNDQVITEKVMINKF